MLFEKMLQLGEDMTGSAKEEKKDEKMQKSQEEIMREIEEDRNRLRNIREQNPNQSQ